MVILAGNNIALDRKYIVTDDFEFHSHPNYDWRLNDTEEEKENRTFHWDIGIIVLDNEINLDNPRFKNDGSRLKVNTICLPKETQKFGPLRTVRPATFFGWGLMSGPFESRYLQKADIMVTHGYTNDCLNGSCFTTIVEDRETNYTTACDVS